MHLLFFLVFVNTAAASSIVLADNDTSTQAPWTGAEYEVEPAAQGEYESTAPTPMPTAFPADASSGTGGGGTGSTYYYQLQSGSTVTINGMTIACGGGYEPLCSYMTTCASQSGNAALNACSRYGASLCTRQNLIQGVSSGVIPLLSSTGNAHCTNIDGATVWTSTLCTPTPTTTGLIQAALRGGANQGCSLPGDQDSALALCCISNPNYVTESPTSFPTRFPTPLPTGYPTHRPTSLPTLMPTKKATKSPTTKAPTTSHPATKPTQKPSPTVPRTSSPGFTTAPAVLPIGTPYDPLPGVRVIGADGSYPANVKTWYSLKYSTIAISDGDEVLFRWSGTDLVSLVLVPDFASWIACDFTEATVIIASQTFGTFTLSTQGRDGQSLYFASATGTQCYGGYKLTVLVTAPRNDTTTTAAPVLPTVSPSAAVSLPTSRPTHRPTTRPTKRPTPQPTPLPTTDSPSAPTGAPAVMPQTTHAPADTSTHSPTHRPTKQPTKQPTATYVGDSTAAPVASPTGTSIASGPTIATGGDPLPGLTIGADGSYPAGTKTWHSLTSALLAVSDGDKVVFKWSGGTSSLVFLPSYSALMACDFSMALTVILPATAGTFTFLTAGRMGQTYYFASSVGTQCASGYRVSIQVGPPRTNGSPTLKPTTALPSKRPTASKTPAPPPTSIPTAQPIADVYTQGGPYYGADGLGLTSGRDTWGEKPAHSTVNVPLDSTVVFKWSSVTSSVASVPNAAALSSCDTSSATVLAAPSLSGRYLLDTSSFADGESLYIVSMDPTQCADGVRVTIIVGATTAPTHKPTPPPTPEPTVSRVNCNQFSKQTGCEAPGNHIWCKWRYLLGYCDTLRCEGFFVESNCLKRPDCKWNTLTDKCLSIYG